MVGILAVVAAFLLAFVYQWLAWVPVALVVAYCIVLAVSARKKALWVVASFLALAALFLVILFPGVEWVGAVFVIVFCIVLPFLIQVS